MASQLPQGVSKAWYVGRIIKLLQTLGKISKISGDVFLLHRLRGVNSIKLLLYRLGFQKTTGF